MRFWGCQRKRPTSEAHGLRSGSRTCYSYRLGAGADHPGAARAVRLEVGNPDWQRALTVAHHRVGNVPRMSARRSGRWSLRGRFDRSKASLTHGQDVVAERTDFVRGHPPDFGDRFSNVPECGAQHEQFLAGDRRHDVPSLDPSSCLTGSVEIVIAWFSPFRSLRRNRMKRIAARLTMWRQGAAVSSSLRSTKTIRNPSSLGKDKSAS